MDGHALEATLRAIIAATPSDAVRTVRVTGLALPPDRKPGRIVGEGPEAVGELVRLLRDEAKVL